MRLVILESPYAGDIALNVESCESFKAEQAQEREQTEVGHGKQEAGQ